VESTSIESPIENVGQPTPLLQLEKLIVVAAKIIKGRSFFNFFKDFIINRLKRLGQMYGKSYKIY